MVHLLISLVVLDIYMPVRLDVASFAKLSRGVRSGMLTLPVMRSMTPMWWCPRPIGGVCARDLQVGDAIGLCTKVCSSRKPTVRRLWTSISSWGSSGSFFTPSTPGSHLWVKT
jgi:hypothetical protein